MVYGPYCGINGVVSLFLSTGMNLLVTRIAVPQIALDGQKALLPLP